MSADSIQDYILQDEETLRIAAAVGDAWHEVRGRIVKEFLNKLGERLTKELPGWKTSVWRECYVDAKACFYLWKKHWDNQYYVTLQFAEYGRSMLYGVQRDKPAVDTKRPLSAELLEAARKVVGDMHSWAWWEAQAPMREPAADWRSAEVLWRMRSDETFLASVSDQLLEVARAVEPHVDRLVEQYPLHGT